MQNAWLISIAIWAVLTAGLFTLIIYRRILASGEYDVLHIRESEFPLVPQQAAFARRVERVDFWGKLLTVVTICYGLVLCAVFLYQVWIRASV
jgi:hypothetical protein